MGYLLVATTLSSGFSASAQVVPGGGAPTRGTHAQPASATSAAADVSASTHTSSGAQSIEDWVLVRGLPEDIAEARSAPASPRYMVREDDISVISRAQWLERGWSTESFEARRHQSASLCTRTMSYTARANNLMQRYAATQPRLAELAERYERMGRQIRRAGAIRTLGNILAVAAGIATGGLGYGAVVAGGAVGGEAQGRASTRQQRLANDHGALTLELTGMSVEGNLMWLETYQDYLETMTLWCTRPDIVRSLSDAAAANPTNRGASRG